MKYTKRIKPRCHDAQTRIMLSKRFKAMITQLGLTPCTAAQFLQVSPRTLHNWLSCHHDIPYTAYRLLRLSLHQELPPPWTGWSFSAGQLWSPEGYGFKPTDSSWWSLLVRRATCASHVYQENLQLRRALAAASLVDTSERREAPLDLSLGHFGTRATQRMDWPASYLDPRDCPAPGRHPQPKRLSRFLDGGKA